MQIRAEPRKSALPICNYSQILYQFLTFTQNLKRSLFKSSSSNLFIAKVKYRKLQPPFVGNCRINGWGKCRF